MTAGDPAATNTHSIADRIRATYIRRLPVNIYPKLVHRMQHTNEAPSTIEFRMKLRERKLDLLKTSSTFEHRIHKHIAPNDHHIHIELRHFFSFSILSFLTVLVAAAIFYVVPWFLVTLRHFRLQNEWCFSTESTITNDKKKTICNNIVAASGEQWFQMVQCIAFAEICFDARLADICSHHNFHAMQCASLPCAYHERHAYTRFSLLMLLL